LDLTRDQSYFLFSTTQNQLNFLRFPLGSIQKNQTREIAKELKLNVANKPDSQDICFVPNGDYASVIQKFKPGSFKKGKIFDKKRNIIGEHNGIINFTIGQRKGIKIAHTEPLYVIDINASNNEVTVGSKDDLIVKKIYLKNLNILSEMKPHEDDLLIKVRSTGKLIKAEIKLKETETEVFLKEPEAGVSPGQACVFYKKNNFGLKVLGGGWITKAEKNFYPHN